MFIVIFVFFYFFFPKIFYLIILNILFVGTSIYSLIKVKFPSFISILVISLLFVIPFTSLSLSLSLFRYRMGMILFLEFPLSFFVSKITLLLVFDITSIVIFSFFILSLSSIIAIWRWKPSEISENWSCSTFDISFSKMSCLYSILEKIWSFFCWTFSRKIFESVLPLLFISIAGFVPFAFVSMPRNNIWSSY